MDFTYTVIFEPAEEGGFLAHVPALNGATTQGETLEEARAMAQDLIQGCIEAEIKRGHAIPVEETHSSSKGEHITVSVQVVASAV